MVWWPWKKRDTAPPASSQTLADIARGMQHAVNSTQELVEQHYAQVIERYFEEDPPDNKNGPGLYPKIVTFKLPNGHVMTVPMIALVRPEGLMLKEMEVRMTVRIDQAKVKPHAKHGEHSAITRTSFECSFAPSVKDAGRHSNVVDITMKFVAGDPPEGVARVIEQYANTALPSRREPPTPQGPGLTSPSPEPPSGTSAPEAAPGS
jgi:hypothetical protein